MPQENRMMDSGLKRVLFALTIGALGAMLVAGVAGAQEVGGILPQSPEPFSWPMAIGFGAAATLVVNACVLFARYFAPHLLAPKPSTPLSRGLSRAVALVAGLGTGLVGLVAPLPVLGPPWVGGLLSGLLVAAFAAFGRDVVVHGLIRPVVARHKNGESGQARVGWVLAGLVLVPALALAVMPVMAPARVVGGNVVEGAAASSTNPVLEGGRADTTTPSAVDDGDVVSQFATTTGAAVVAGHSGAAPVMVKTDAGGAVQVDVESGSITADTELPAAAALSDDAANPTTPTVGVALLGFDGVTWDRVVIGAGTEAAALRVTVATDSTGVISVDDNGGALTVDGTADVSVVAAPAAAVANDAAGAAADATMLAAAANTRLCGFAMVEDAAVAAAAKVILRHGVEAAGSCTGNAITIVSLVADESRSEWFGDRCIAVPSGVCVDVSAGTVTIALQSVVEVAP